MSSHRTLEMDPGEDPSARKPRPRRTDQEPLDAKWIENEGLRALRRHEKSRAGLAKALKIALQKRCERTGEMPDAATALIPAVLDGLEERRFLDDRRYATAMLERHRAKGYASDRIEAKLLQKGFSSELTQDLLHENDPDADRRAAWRTAKRKRLGPYCLDAEKRNLHRERHLAALGRDGFSLEVAMEIIEAKEAPPKAFFEGIEAADGDSQCD